jgi:NCK-associated protein 1
LTRFDAVLNTAFFFFSAPNFFFSFQRMTIIGVILSFRSLLDDALNSQLDERIPFLYSTINDVHEHNAAANR